MIEKEQIQEWADNQVTLLFFQTLKDMLRQIEGTSRYSQTIRVFSSENKYSDIPASSDSIAMQNAFVDGKVQILKEIINTDLTELT